MKLGMTRNEGESWLNAALRYAEPYGLEQEVRDWYDRMIELGLTEQQAVVDALYEWDLLDIIDEEGQ